MIVRGSVIRTDGQLIEAALPGARVGSGVRIATSRGAIHGKIVALQQGTALVAPLAGIEGVRAGNAVTTDRAMLALPLGTPLLGRAIDAFGRALDGGMHPTGMQVPVTLSVPGASQRTAIRVPFWTGIRAIDALCTIGRGARIGLFGAPGAGKSTVLRALRDGAQSDAVVIALVGERGREAAEWMHEIPPHSSVVCATSDRAPAERVHAARVAMAQAAALRSLGLHVLLVIDSLARFAAALREIALASGESAGRGGYPPSVFADLAAFTEVAGTTARGSITTVATVLSDGDERDPVSESARSLLDGHLHLSAALARNGHYPAVDIGASVSRTMSQVASPAHLRDAAEVRTAITSLTRVQDARSLGILPVEPAAVRAIDAEGELLEFLRQDRFPHPAAETVRSLRLLADRLR